MILSSIINGNDFHEVGLINAIDLAFVIDTSDYQRRMNVVLDSINEYDRCCKSSTYLREQAYNLIFKMIARGNVDLATALMLELDML